MNTAGRAACKCALARPPTTGKMEVNVNWWTVAYPVARIMDVGIGLAMRALGKKPYWR